MSYNRQTARQTIARDHSAHRDKLHELLAAERRLRYYSRDSAGTYTAMIRETLLQFRASRRAYWRSIHDSKAYVRSA